MKIDRLIGIVFYLLNRDIVNSNTLAQKFEVSTRTIQRDIESLNLAGIPIVSIQGPEGGYGIVESFKFRKHMTSTEDCIYIVAALRGLCTAYGNKKIQETLERITHAVNTNIIREPKIRLDFSVSREVSNIDENLEIINEAIDEEKVIQFSYTNSYGENRVRIAEVVGIIYKWYSWYILSYCHEKRDYRLFKVARISNLQKLKMNFTMEHSNLDILLKQYEEQDKNQYWNIKMSCKEEVRSKVMEYIPKGQYKSLDNDSFIVEFSVPNNEVGWKGILLTFGNKITILEPVELKVELTELAEEILNNYN